VKRNGGDSQKEASMPYRRKRTATKEGGGLMRNRYHLLQERRKKVKRKDRDEW